MPSSTFQQQEEQQLCRCPLGQDPLKNPDERRHRYENLKSSVAVLRSKFRSTPPASPSPSSPSSVHADLVPFQNYFSSLEKCTATHDRNRSTCSLPNQIEACSLLESYAMQALRIDCETRLKEGREELEKVREKLKDKVRRTELYERELEKQRKKLDGRIAFFSERSKVLENQLAEQSARHKEELWAQSEAFTASREQEDEESRKQIKEMISDYEDGVATLKENSERQLAEIQTLKQEFSTRLEQMEKSKNDTEDQLKYLNGQLKLVAQQSETFRMSYEAQEREWNVKLQHITAMHQYQTKTLSEDFEFQIEKVRKEMKEEKDQHISKMQEYKAQKLVDMENVEQRIKGVLEAKDCTIANLKLELKILHQQLAESASMLDDDCKNGSLVRNL